MKTSVISERFRERYLSNPDDPEAFEGRAVVFDGREDYHARINDPSLEIDEYTAALSAGPGRSVIPAARKWSTCSRPMRLLKSGHHTNCPVSATDGNPGHRALHRSSTLRRRRLSVAVWH